ncbi:polysaccharide deacetylase (plasmid) [Peptoclostridium acidaminophilum DSM 3953]|uniref:Polysaccharide deacetylase n=1 Tax=Peptoclostridium acidaminophilum DSM 3953 TaxID=1286171 RepID=W8UBM9_PEPAC|nr:polysaccharide deacetylase family protein [Peptoclostridium acidaminophilum]AHM58126.1 polysaccharide deacetylase [Peptoclostridium acidaminophilum DSM 3953]
MKSIILTLIISSLLLTGCGNQEVSSAGEKAAADPKASIDLELKPNEAGKIMVLMYHNIGSEESEWTRTPANFIRDLEILYEKGYRPISLSDYVTGNITTEQGFTPVVITFDDGNKNNFEYLENGEISKECAVGLLLDFHEKHKDFPLEATFFVDGNRPFRQGGLESKKLKFIIDSGMDIGNHTLGHMNLKSAAAEEMQEQIGSQAQYLLGLIDKEGYEINTLALPFGGRPKDESLTGYLSLGSFNGVAYENIAVLNVGWHPGQSPYNAEFNPASIPRIRGSETKVDSVGLYDYLDYFDRNPQEKFISDGVAGIITIPEDKRESIDSAVEREIYTYNLK